jgi:hypothetical protein
MVSFSVVSKGQLDSYVFLGGNTQVAIRNSTIPGYPHLRDCPEFRNYLCKEFTDAAVVDQPDTTNVFFIQINFEVVFVRILSVSID